MPPLDEPPPLPSPKRRAGCATWLLRLFAIGVVLVVAASGTMLFLMRSGRIPDSRILDRHELHERIVDRLRALELQEGEEIVLFYSGAPFDVAFDGNLLTDRRVVSWFEKDDEERVVDSVDLDSIDRIEVRFTSHVFEDSTLEVYENVGGDSIYSATLLLSNEEDGDHLFVEELVKRARRADAPLRAVEVSGEISGEELSRIPDAVRVESAEQ
ncbi:MAG: hypothetical protein AAFP22_14535 [Planctomycetota bacterium]